MEWSTFYQVNEKHVASDGSMEAVISLNVQHPIFQGHFPQQPVMPGVCMIQIIKDLLQSNWQSNVVFKELNQVKFLNTVIPEDNVPLKIAITWSPLEDKSYQCQATLTKSDVVCLKLLGIFTN